MIRLVIFDLDGVLVDSRELHYESMNAALFDLYPSALITREEHLSTYDGLPTSKKLNLLTQNKALPRELHSQIWQRKQEFTVELLNQWDVDEQKRSVLKAISKTGVQIAVCSNSIRPTMKVMLNKRGLLPYVDRYYSNEDVKRPKPSSEMYLRAMLDAGVDPKHTLIIEDSHIGRQAAINSGAHLLAVRGPEDVTEELVFDHLEIDEAVKPKWLGGKMNIVVPMAGAGSRFAKVGYTFPKPLVPIHKFGGKPMIEVVVNNLNISAQYIYIVQKEHYEKYNLQFLLQLITPNCIIVQTDGVTEGAACSVLLAKEHINNDNQLLISDSDHFVEWDSNVFMYSMQGDTIDGGILTFPGSHPAWSFSRIDDTTGFIVEVAEKKPISHDANVGRYYWTKGSDFVKYAEQMIVMNKRVNNEFYIAPIYNEAIADGKKIKPYPITKRWELGTPEDLAYFEQNYGVTK